MPHDDDELESVPLAPAGPGAVALRLTNRLLIEAIREQAEEIRIWDTDSASRVTFVIDRVERELDLPATMADLLTDTTLPAWAQVRALHDRIGEMAQIDREADDYPAEGGFELMLSTRARLQVRFDVRFERAAEGLILKLRLTRV